MSKNSLRTGVILNYVNMGFGNLIPLFYTPIMLSLLGQNEYGLYKLSCSITSYLGLLAMGLGAAVNRYLVKSRIEGGQDAEEKMLGLFVIIFRVITALTIICGTILAFNLDVWYADSLQTDEMLRMFILTLIMVANTALSFSVAPYMSIVTAREEYLFYQLMNIVTTCVLPLANLVVLYAGYASIGMAVSSLVINLLIRIVYLVYIHSRLHIHAQFKNLPTGVFKEIIGFSFWIFVTNIVDQLYNATDTLMIGARPELATTGVAVYSVGTVFSGMALSIAAGVSAVLMPRTTKMVFEGAASRELTEFAIKVGRLQIYLISAICACFFLFGKPFLHFYVGDEYAMSFWIALVVMVPMCIPLAQSACLNILVARNLHKYRAIMLLIIAIINVLGTWLVLPHWGIVGAAIMTGSALVLGNGVIMNYFYQKKTDIELRYFWSEIAKCFVAPVAMCAVGYFAFQFIDLYNIVTLLISGMLFFIILFILQYFMVFNDYEKEMFTAPFKKIKR